MNTKNINVNVGTSIRKEIAVFLTSVVKLSNCTLHWFRMAAKRPVLNTVFFHTRIYFFLNCLKMLQGKHKARLSELINASTSNALWWRAEDLCGTLSKVISLDFMLGPCALGAAGMKPSQQSTLSEIKLLTLLQKGNRKEGQYSLSGN